MIKEDLIIEILLDLDSRLKSIENFLDPNVFHKKRQDEKWLELQLIGQEEDGTK